MSRAQEVHVLLTLCLLVSFADNLTFAISQDPDRAPCFNWPDQDTLIVFLKELF